MCICSSVYSPMSFVLEALGVEGMEARELFSRYCRTFAVTSLYLHVLGNWINVRWKVMDECYIEGYPRLLH